jgi:NodT family efflux transporter outer membrane factor (OMF) lipoprotein
MPENPPPEMVVPELWSTEHNSTVESINNSWFGELNSPPLENLINEALQHNQEIQIANLTWRAAEQNALITGTNTNLKSELGVSGKRVQTLSSTNKKVFTTTHSLDLSTSWEMDLWDRLSKQQQAAVVRQKASHADLEAARFSLAAKVARSWFRTIDATQQIKIAEERVTSYEHALEVITARQRVGLVDILDLHLSKSEVAIAEERLASREMEQRESIRTLESLLGRYPGADKKLIASLTQNQLSITASQIPSGLPSQLLERRADIVASRERMLAAGLDAEIAASNRLPSFSLTAKTGTSSEELHNILDFNYLVWSLIGNLTQPLFQQDRLKAEEMLNKIKHREAWFNHSKTLLTAFQEVENALSADKYQQRRVEALTRAANESQAAAKLALSRYEIGLSDIITLLDAQRRSYDRESARLTAIAKQIDNRILLHLALGGGYV